MTVNLYFNKTFFFPILVLQSFPSPPNTSLYFHSTCCEKKRERCTDRQLACTVFRWERLLKDFFVLSFFGPCQLSFFQKGVSLFHVNGSMAHSTKASKYLEKKLLKSLNGNFKKENLENGKVGGEWKWQVFRVGSSCKLLHLCANCPSTFSL